MEKIKLILILLFVLIYISCARAGLTHIYSSVPKDNIQESMHVNDIDIDANIHQNATVYETKVYNKLLQKKNFKINSKLRLKGINFDKNTQLLDFQQGDINGDKIADNILLYGTSIDNFAVDYRAEISIIIQDGKSKKLTFIHPEFGFGYSYSIYLGDFYEDKLKDVLISVNTGMSGGEGQYAYGIYSFMDNYKVKIFCTGFSKSIVGDVNKNSEFDNEYYKNGKLIYQLEGFADNYNKLIPKDVDNDGVLELKGSQYISGSGHSDGIGEAYSVLKWDKDNLKWVMKDLSFKSFN